MRKITQQVVSAFLSRKAKSKDNTSTNGQALFLHGNKIAEWRGNCLWISSAGWNTSTTKDRLNALPGVRIYQKDFQWFLHGQPWDGQWTIANNDQLAKAVIEETRKQS